MKNLALGKIERNAKDFYLETIGAVRPSELIYSMLGFLSYPYPKNVTFEITNSCNLKCIMCAHPHMKRKIGFIDFDFYKKIIDQIEGKVDSISLYSTGEPLLHPKIIEIIKYAKLKGISCVQTSTNATLLNEKISKSLVGSGLDFLQVSIEGCNKEEYEKIRKGANFEKVKEKLKRFLEIRGKNKKPLLDIHFLIHKKSNVKKFVEAWGDYCDKIHVSAMYPIRVFDKNKNKMMFIIPKEAPLYELSGKVKGCLQPFSNLVISYDGKVGMCCGDFDFDLVMGDAKKNKLIDIYNNKLYRNIRKSFVLKRFQKTFCNGCPTLYPIKEKEVIFDAQIVIDKLMKSKKEKAL